MMGAAETAATQAMIAPWAQYGILGSVVLALALAVVWLVRKQSATQALCDALQEARLADHKDCTARFTDMLMKKFDSDNRLADGMEAFERVVDKVTAK